MWDGQGIAKKRLFVIKDGEELEHMKEDLANEERIGAYWQLTGDVQTPPRLGLLS